VYYSKISLEVLTTELQWLPV